MSKELIERLEAEEADEAGIFTGTARVVPMAVVKPIIEKLEAERDALRLVCAEAYQMAGALNAPTKALDNLSAASAGAPLPHETFLPVEAPQIDREKVRDAIAECLGAMIYCCTRQWSAWGVGTMSQNDFVLASEDDGILDELTAAAISAIEAKPESGSAS